MSFPDFSNSIKSYVEKSGRHRIRNDAIDEIQKFFNHYFIEKKNVYNQKIKNKKSFEEVMGFGVHKSLDKYLHKSIINGNKLSLLKEYFIINEICEDEYLAVYGLLIIDLLLSEIIEKSIQYKENNKKFITYKIIQQVLTENYEYFFE